MCDTTKAYLRRVLNPHLFKTEKSRTEIIDELKKELKNADDANKKHSNYLMLTWLITFIATATYPYTHIDHSHPKFLLVAIGLFYPTYWSSNALLSWFSRKSISSLNKKISDLTGYIAAEQDMIARNLSLDKMSN